MELIGISKQERSFQVTSKDVKEVYMITWNKALLIFNERIEIWDIEKGEMLRRK